MIKNVSSIFKANCKEDSVKYREYIVIDNKEVDIKGDLSDTAYKDTTFFGKFNLKMLKFETENDIDYKKKEFVYYKEVNGEALKIGTFIVTEVKDSDTFESVNVTAYDYGLKFANPYTTSLDYSNTTLFQLIQEICTNCGVELENALLPNGDFIVDSNQFVNGEQFGDVVAQASGINGMFATINSNDKLEFIFTNETNEIIEDYVELDDKRDTWPITSVLVATSEDLETAGAVKKDQALIDKYGEHWLKIYSYGFAYSTEKCQQLVNAIFNQVKGFAYSSFKSEYSFLPYLSLGDKIKFKNKEGKLVDSVILRYETNYDEITLEAPSIINASVDYELPETPETTSKKALFKVDQALGEIDAISKKVVDISSTASGVGFVNITNGYKGNLYKLDIYGYMELPIVGGQLGTSPSKVGISKVGYAITKTYKKYIKPLIIGEFKVNNFYLFVEQNGEVLHKYILPVKYLYSVGSVHDEFNYLDGKCSVLRRIGVHANGEKYVLAKPYKEELPDLIIEVPEGDYKIYTNYETLHLNVEYLTQNQYTSTFATQVDVQSSIKIATDEVLIESKREILDNGDALIASINTKSTGEVLINASKAINFNSAEFNVTTEKMKITIGEGDNKKDIINANGVLTNLQFKSANQVWGNGQSSNYFLGFSPYINDNDGSFPSEKSYLQLDYDIPENFVVRNAYVTIFHTPVNWENNTSVKTWGYCRNLGVYNVYNSGDFKVNAAFFSEGQAIGEFNSAAITNAFGNATYWTARKPSNSSYLSESVTTKDIASSLNTSGHGTLLVQSNDTPPYSSTIDGLYTENGAGGKTGSAYAILNIIGYTKV